MAYFMADVEGLKLDQREECRLSTNVDATEEDLKKIGVELGHIDFDAENADEELERFVKKFDMNHHDVIRISRETFPNFDQMLTKFFTEHLHDDAEVRIIKDGAGYFDVRGADERWIRIPTRRGAVAFLPAGIYHRFTPDVAEDVTAIRLFRNNPRWLAFNRAENAEEQPIRAQYLKDIKA